MMHDDPATPTARSVLAGFARLARLARARRLSRGLRYRTTAATARAVGAVLVLIGVGAVASCGGQPNCEAHTCPSWSRLDPYTCTCVDPDANARQSHAVSGQPPRGADAGKAGARE